MDIEEFYDKKEEKIKLLAKEIFEKFPFIHKVETHGSNLILWRKTGMGSYEDFKRLYSFMERKGWQVRGVGGGGADIWFKRKRGGTLTAIMR